MKEKVEKRQAYIQVYDLEKKLALSGEQIKITNINWDKGGDVISIDFIVITGNVEYEDKSYSSREKITI